jgi:hypothetical protein
VAILEHKGIPVALAAEERCCVEVGEFPRVVAIADEDLERENATKTSAIHWLRFELSPTAREAVRRGATVTVDADHRHYRHADRLSAATLESLGRDLD